MCVCGGGGGGGERGGGGGGGGERKGVRYMPTFVVCPTNTQRVHVGLDDPEVY